MTGRHRQKPSLRPRGRKREQAIVQEAVRAIGGLIVALTPPLQLARSAGPSLFSFAFSVTA
jgi:hypothetical protein